MQTIKVVAIIETEEGVVFDDLAMETTVGLLGTIKSYDIDYNTKEDIMVVKSNGETTIERKERIERDNANIQRVDAQTKKNDA